MRNFNNVSIIMVAVIACLFASFAPAQANQFCSVHEQCAAPPKTIGGTIIPTDLRQPIGSATEYYGPVSLVIFDSNLNPGLGKAVSDLVFSKKNRNKHFKFVPLSADATSLGGRALLRSMHMDPDKYVGQAPVMAIVNTGHSVKPLRGDQIEKLLSEAYGAN